MYFLLLAIAISLSGRSVSDYVLHKEWQLFKLEHSKVYKDLYEELSRNRIYLTNKRVIIEHNRLYELGLVSSKLGRNTFSDLNHEEFVATMNCSRITFDIEAQTFIEPYFDVPKSVDWRQKGAVTEIKDQGDHCAACWAFAATGVLEGQYFRKTGKLVSMSEQNLLDCTSEYGNNGCKNGQVTAAYKYIHDNGGIDTESRYPYEGRNDGKCRYDRSHDSGASVKGFSNIPSGDESALKKAVAANGPIAVYMDGLHFSFQHYKEWVHYEPACNPAQLNHAVLVVGYGSTKNGEDYWIIKNSWGTNWGQYGYGLIARNRQNHCGIASDASYPRL